MLMSRCLGLRGTDPNSRTARHSPSATRHRTGHVSHCSRGLRLSDAVPGHVPKVATGVTLGTVSGDVALTATLETGSVRLRLSAVSGQMSGISAVVATLVAIVTANRTLVRDVSDLPANITLQHQNFYTTINSFHCIRSLKNICKSKAPTA